MSLGKIVNLAFPNTEAQIYIDKGALANIANLCDSRFSATKVLVVSDETVGAVYGDLVKKRMEDKGFQVFNLYFPIDIDKENINQVNKIWNKLAYEHFSRDDILIAVGGASVLNIAGFAASVYKNGMSYVQVPTTLLSMIDTCVGGRNSISYAGTDNLLGCFYQASIVLCDTRCLHTCNNDTWENGFAALVRACLVAPRRSFYEWIRSNAASLKSKDDFSLRDAIYMAVESKANITMKDFIDTSGEQRCFKMGNSFADALCKLEPFDSLSYGLALSEALRFEARLAIEVLGSDSGFLPRLEELLSFYELDEAKFSCSPEELFHKLTKEENSDFESFGFVLLRDINEWDYVKVSDELVYEHISAWCEYKKAFA